ncbi:MAG: hypothetical protein EAY70_08540 [Sphingomonadales bacterium]|nr:MAG: hypothetical protein EAY70_08540 [Sphingomonadales bacterium]
MAALAGLALFATSCSGDTADEALRGPEAVSPAFAKLLVEADTAMARGALADAGRMLDEARGLAPESPDLWVAIARLRFRGGEHLTALEAADRALTYGPDHGSALLLRALMVRDSHGAADALIWFETARTADPGNPDILAEYAATLGDSGAAGAMLNAVRALAEVAPDDARVPYLQAVLAARGGEYTIARSLLARSGMAARGVPAALQLDAIISLAEGNADSAATTLEALAARQPANARLRELLARALLIGNREDELIARFAPEAALPEASPYMVMLVARAYERLGDRAAAAPLLARAHAPMRPAPVPLASREGLPQPTANLRRALLSDDADGARSQASALRARFPASTDVAGLAGDALLGTDNPQDALAAYALASEVRRPWPITRKALWALVRYGNREAADLLLARQVAGETETASALLALAERQADRGDWARTALLLDHAMAIGAGHDPVLLGLRLRAARELNQPQDANRFAALLAEVQPHQLVAR